MFLRVARPSYLSCCLFIVTTDNGNVAGVSATTEQSLAPKATTQGHLPLTLADEPHMSIATAENAGLVPCDIPNQWINNNNNSNSTTNNNNTSFASTPTLATQLSAGLMPSGGSALSGGSLLSPVLSTHQQQQQIMHQQQVKAAQQMMNVVAPAIACPPAASKKIRRKTDNKPQSQINKCNNEKRRRELENEYIEQLGEFLQINKRDMTTTKPDKAHILSEVVKTFRRLLEERDAKAKRPQCHPDCTDQCTVHPVQQGEVSSTEPENSFMNGNSPEKSAYFEAVRHYISNIGWVLLEISSDGRIEYATENVCDVLHYTRTELQGKDIYTFLHMGDHARLSSILSKQTISVAWDQEQDASGGKKATPMRVRWLIKQSENVNETIEQKQQRPEKYKDVIIMSAPLKDDAEESPSMLCLITMPEDDTSEGQLENSGPGFGMNHQFTLKLDTNGKILAISLASLPPEYFNYFTKDRFIGISLQEICHYQDRPKIIKYLHEIRQTTMGDVHIDPYRFGVGPDYFIHVKAQSRIYTPPTEESFIMAVHTILSDSDMQALDQLAPNLSQSLPSTSHAGSTTTPQTINGGNNQQLHQQQQQQSNMGGPLMTSVVNGGINQVLDRLTNQISQVYQNDGTGPTGSESSYFTELGDLDFPTTTFEMDSVSMNWGDSRPDSRLSGTSNTGTPRPPSVSAYSPATCPSPLTSYNPSGMNSQPSPSNNNNNNNFSNTNFNSPGFNSSNYGGNTPNYEKPDEKPNLEKLQAALNEQKLNAGQSPGNTTNNNQDGPKQSFSDSERLRNLLTKRPSSSTSSGDDKNVILKTLLNNDEDNTTLSKCRIPIRSNLEGRLNSNNGGNRMLETLLNEKNSDDDDNEGRSKHSELLRQLKKDSPMKSNEDIIQMLKYQGNDRKRPAPGDSDDPGAKRENPKSLRERNKMLASLLACPAKAPIESNLIQQNPIRTIPDIPKSGVMTNSGISSTTTSQMSPITSSTVMSNNSIDKLASGGQARQLLRKPSSENYLNTMQPNSNNNAQKNELLRQLAANQQQQQQQQQQSPQPQLPQRLQQQQQQSNFQNNQTNDNSSFNNTNSGNVMAHLSSFLGIDNAEDPDLQLILNEVLDSIPDAASSSFEPDFEQILGSMTQSQTAQFQQDVEKKIAINAIQQQLMQCETNAYSGSPPAYSIHSAMSAQQQQQQQQLGNFPPPPNYPNQPNNQRRMPIQLQNNQQGANQTHATTRMLNSAIIQQRKQLAELEKERLLRQQQRQKIVGPSNPAASGAETICMNQGMQNIESSIPPNVSLQRTADNQMSPGFNQHIIQQQLSPNQRPPFSPQGVNYGQGTNQFNPNELSSQNQLQQMLQNYQNNQYQSGNNSPAQLSPMSRQFGPGTPTGQQPPPQWSQALAARGMSVGAQGNPMLSGQLASPNNFNGGRPFIQAQRQRSLNSPVNRSASFQDGFPGPPSPSQAPPYQQKGMFNASVQQQMQQRLQRQQSAPQPMTGSPRPYGVMYNNSPNLPPQHSAAAAGQAVVATNSNSPNDYFNNRSQAAEPGNNINPDFVRQGLRAVVTGRTQSGIRTPQSPLSGLSANSPSAAPPAQQSQLPNTAPLMSNAPSGNPSTGINDMNYNFEPDYYGGNTTR
uniref:CSON013975 protein n=1 Tax=Culicoides sonorensis TaxID=179676 RepID=A0A336MLM1_CULSO